MAKIIFNAIPKQTLQISYQNLHEHDAVTCYWLNFIFLIHTEVEIPPGLGVHRTLSESITIAWGWQYSRGVTFDVRYTEHGGATVNKLGLESRHYQITGLSPTTCYNISVRAVDKATGEVGDFSEELVDCTSKKIV